MLDSSSKIDIAMAQQEIYFSAMTAEVLEYRATGIGIVGAITLVYGRRSSLVTAMNLRHLLALNLWSQSSGA